MNRPSLKRSLSGLVADKRRLLLWSCYGVAAVALGAGGMYLWGQQFLQASPAAQDGDHEDHKGRGHEGHRHEGDGRAHGEAGHKEGGHAGHEGHKEHKPGHVRLPKQKQKSAGLQVEPVYRGQFQQAEWVTGKLAVNQDRTAHIYPLVKGRIHKINVYFGQQVEKGDLLTVIDSRELGDAKLALYQNRLEAGIAQANHEWTEKINENTQALINALEEGASLEKIESMFRGKAMGEFRQKLLASYADLHKAKADYDRLKPLTEKGITSEAQLTAAKAAYEAAQAKFQSWLEQLKFTAWMDAFHAEQKVDRAQSDVDVSLAKLQVLGYSPDQLKNINPKAEGEAISHYEVRAPFDGTIVGKDAALKERVGPDKQLFELTDLSTLWLEADIYQKHLPHLETLSGSTIRFRVPEYGHTHKARVFYRGEVLDPKTRTARLTALVENPDGHLKPGMFVEVEIPGKVVKDVLQVPASAVIEDKGESYVYVQKGNEEFVRRDVKVGLSSDGLVQIVEGLKAGDQVAVGGLFALKTAAQGDVASTHSH